MPLKGVYRQVVSSRRKKWRRNSKNSSYRDHGYDASRRRAGRRHLDDARGEAHHRAAPARSREGRSHRSGVGARQRRRAPRGEDDRRLRRVEGPRRSRRDSRLRRRQPIGRLGEVGRRTRHQPADQGLAASLPRAAEEDARAAPRRHPQNRRVRREERHHLQRVSRRLVRRHDRRAWSTWTSTSTRSAACP